MLEIEQKFRVADPQAVIARLSALGARSGEQHVESDHYLNAPDRDFAQTGEAFRLRRIGERNFITFKGRKEPGAVKIREEIELPLPSGDAMAQQYLRLFEQLGYRFVAIVRKQRHEWSLLADGFDLMICLDSVDHLGWFCEVEILAEREQIDRAAGVVTRVADELGLTQVEPRSYLRMVLEVTGS